MASGMHAIMIPFPAQGHITPMFQLALKLLGQGQEQQEEQQEQEQEEEEEQQQQQQQHAFSTISFVNTDYDHHLILANGNSHDLLQLPGLRLLSIPDGLPPHHARLNDPGPLQTFSLAIDALFAPFQSLIHDIVARSSPPVTCIIADSLFCWMADIAHTVGVPSVSLWTSPTHANLAYCSISDLWLQGILPVNCQERESTQRIVDCVPGVPPLQASELPSFLQTPDGSPQDFFFQWSLKRFGAGVPQGASWHLGNVIYELDKEATHAFQECVGNYLPVGPLLPQPFFSGQMAKAPAMGMSLWVEDKGCKEWLDKQEDCSVLYISFGSIVHMATQQVEEVAAGVEASRRPFLWVLRSDVDATTLAKLEAMKERSGSRGLIVSWAPQLLVLSHPSVGAFLTHCGWNSILEGISSGLPMLAWPGGFAEQKMNAHYLIHVWQIGLGFTLDLSQHDLPLVRKHEVERVIHSIFDSSMQARALKERVIELQKMVRNALKPPNGSSQANLHRFLEAMAHLESNTQ